MPEVVDITISDIVIVGKFRWTFLGFICAAVLPSVVLLILQGSTDLFVAGMLFAASLVTSILLIFLNMRRLVRNSKLEAVMDLQDALDAEFHREIQDAIERDDV